MMADFVTGRWSAELEVLFLRVSGRFGRIEVRRRMRDYVPGLLGPVSRKNSPPEGAPPRQLAECAGHNGPYGLQHLLSWSRWDPDELRDDVQSYVAEKLGAPGGVLRKMRQGFSLATLRSTGARAADRARFIVRSVAVRSWCGRRLIGVVTHEPAPMWARSARTGTPWRSQIRMMRWARAAVRSWVRPGSAGEIHSSLPAGSATTCTFTPWRRCLWEKPARLSPTRSHSASVPSRSCSRFGSR